MARVNYTEDQINEFIEVASEMGVGPAMRSLGYPGSHHTASKWFTDRNMEVPGASALMAKAANLHAFYTDKEKIMAAQTVIDRVMEKLEGEALTAEEINKLGAAVHRAVQTIALVEGKATHIQKTQNEGEIDRVIEDILNDAKARNEAQRSFIEHHTRF